MITALSLENFAAFKKLDLEFSSGINIIIGENSVRRISEGTE
ncbi:AAA family ATPase [Photobacterium frigidiphilum]|nr:AAA family ATPase [Photobacterium frigidiphilum]